MKPFAMIATLGAIAVVGALFITSKGNSGSIDQPYNDLTPPTGGQVIQEKEKLAPNREGLAQQQPSMEDSMARIQAIKAHLDKNPNDQEALMSLANANMMIKRMDKAEDLYERLLTLNSGRLDARTNLSIIRLDQGRTEEAVSLLQANLKLSPDDDATLFNLGAIHFFHRKDTEKALEVWTHLLETHPESPSAKIVRQQVQKIRAKTSQSPSG